MDMYDSVQPGELRAVIRAKSHFETAVLADDSMKR